MFRNVLFQTQESRGSAAVDRELLRERKEQWLTGADQQLARFLQSFLEHTSCTAPGNLLQRNCFSNDSYSRLNAPRRWNSFWRINLIESFS